MKAAFSSSWISSKQPRKQRKYRFNAPMHIRGKYLSAPLAKDLRAKHNVRSLRVKVGDKVKVVRGQFKGKEAKIERIDLTKCLIFLTDIGITKKSGERVLSGITASNVVVTALVNIKSRFKTKGQNVATPAATPAPKKEGN